MEKIDNKVNITQVYYDIRSFQIKLSLNLAKFRCNKDGLKTSCTYNGHPRKKADVLRVKVNYTIHD